MLAIYYYRVKYHDLKARHDSFFKSRECKKVHWIATICHVSSVKLLISKLEFIKLFLHIAKHFMTPILFKTKLLGFIGRLGPQTSNFVMLLTPFLIHALLGKHSQNMIKLLI